MLEKLTELPSLIIASAIGVVVVYYLIQRKNDQVKKVPHDCFHRLWICPPGSHTRWEAEVDVELPGADKKVGFYSETLHDQVAVEGPTDAEVAFCKRLMGNLNELFELTQPAVAKAWKDWGKRFKRCRKQIYLAEYSRRLCVSSRDFERLRGGQGVLLRARVGVCGTFVFSMQPR